MLGHCHTHLWMQLTMLGHCHTHTLGFTKIKTSILDASGMSAKLMCKFVAVLCETGSAKAALTPK